MKTKKNAVPIVVDNNLLVPSLFQSTTLYDLLIEKHFFLMCNYFIYYEARDIICRLYENTKKYKQFNKDMSENWHKISNILSSDPNDNQFLYAAETGWGRIYYF